MTVFPILGELTKKKKKKKKEKSVSKVSNTVMYVFMLL